MGFSYYTAPVQIFLNLVHGFGLSGERITIFVVGRKKSPAQPSPDFPSLDGPWKCFFIWQTYSLLLTDQALITCI